jgi:hypothetical protein
MDQDLEQGQGVATTVTRRTVVKTGAKLAYAAPLVAVSMRLSSTGALADGWVWMDVIPLESDGGSSFTTFTTLAAKTQPEKPHCDLVKVVICHRTCSDHGGNQHNGYSAIEIAAGDSCNPLTPDRALEAHIVEQHNNTTCQDGRQDVFPRNVTDDKKLAECPSDDGTIQSLP